MPRQNRVDPYGRIIAAEDRGTLMGNRGCLHDAGGMIRRPHRGRRWIACELEFRGRRRALMQPGRYTELFFLDEVTALAAGHRPCAECRRAAYLAYGAAAGFGGTSADLLDRRLHTERTRQRSTRPLDEVPDGSFIHLKGGARPLLVMADLLLEWTPGGYAAAIARSDARVIVLTPETSLRALAGGYRASVHPSATSLRADSGRAPVDPQPSRAT